MVVDEFVMANSILSLFLTPVSVSLNSVDWSFDTKKVNILAPSWSRLGNSGAAPHCTAFYSTTKFSPTALHCTGSGCTGFQTWQPDYEVYRRPYNGPRVGELANLLGADGRSSGSARAITGGAHGADHLTRCHQPQHRRWRSPVPNSRQRVVTQKLSMWHINR